MTRCLRSPVTGTLCRVVLGGAFLYANALKLFHPEETARLIQAYRILHPDLLNLAAITLPWMQALPAALLVAGLWVRGAALALAAMLVGFTGAAASVMARGMEIDCGCSLPFLGERVDWVMVVRNLVLLSLAGQIIAWPSSFLSARRSD